MLAGCTAVLMTLALGSGLGMVGRAAALDARVQLAADAAALAAVAESTPGGSGRPEDHARRYAEANGARLIECICVPGRAAMQVRVAIGAAAATARAVFEAELLVPAPPEGSDDGSG